MKKFKLTTTVSYYNDESEDLEADFKKDMQKDNRIEIVAEVVENCESHISGIVTDILEIKEGENIKEKVQNYMHENSLIGECFSLKDVNDRELFTEEDIYFQ